MDNSSPEMIIFIGIPASGKSTFYEENFAAAHIRISLDILRTRFQENKMLKECINSGKSCVIDNTNVSIPERKKYIDIAKEHGYKIRGFYFRLSMLAQSLYSHKELIGRKREDLQELCWKKGHNWNDLTTPEKRGSAVYKVQETKSSPYRDVVRMKFVIDEDIPVFSADDCPCSTIF